MDNSTGTVATIGSSLSRGTRAERNTMSAGTMGNIGRSLNAQRQNGGFLQYRAVLIFASQIVLVALTYYVSFLLRLDANLDGHDQAIFWKTLPFVLLIKL